MRTRLGLMGVCGFSCVLSLASAAAQAPLTVPLAAPKQLRIDGDLGDWHGLQFAGLGDREDSRAEVALAHDADGLYVAARVFDDAFVRSAHPSPREDALLLRLALPHAGGWQTRELWLFAGTLGESPASAQLMAAGKLQRLTGNPRIVEGPAPHGYTLEAFLPWSSIDTNAARDASWRFARGSLALHDVDRAGQPARDVPKLAASGAELPWLLLDGGPVAALHGFLEQKNLDHSKAALDWVGDVRGDGRLERVLVIGTYAVSSDSDGAFAFADLPVARAADVLSAQMLDLTGDRRPELLLHLRAHDAQGERETWQVFDLGHENPRAIFAVENRVATRAGALEANVTIDAAAPGHPASIRIRGTAAHGLSPETYSDTQVSGVIAIPTPWGAWLERVYAWDGQRFVVRQERANPHAHVASKQTTTAAAPTAPQPLAADSPATVSALLAAYRTARGLAPDVSPRFVQQVNLAGDARLESLSVFGRECVVVGEGFRGGRDFFYFGLPVQDGREVLQVFTGDLTGDGRHELFARIRQQIGAVTREVLYIYTFDAERLEPLFAVEVGRSQGGQSVANQVSLVPESGRVALRIAPGTAHGWSASDYPFSAESRDGVAPLLLPWKDRALCYEYDGRQLVARVTNE